MDTDFTAESDYLAHCGNTLRRRFGAGTAVAIFSETVVDFGEDADEVRARVEGALGEPVFVAVIPESDATPQRPLRQPHRRRVRFSYETWMEQGEYLGDELLVGIIHSDAVARRYSEFDYRLLVKCGIVSPHTVLVGGIIFWALGHEPPPDAE